jgi:hypothetical protein
MASASGPGAIVPIVVVDRTTVGFAIAARF